VVYNVKRRLIPLLTLFILALSATAVSAAGRPAKIKLANSSLGKILVNSSGRTVYMFTKDGRNKDKCQSITGCTSIWPPVTTHGKPIAGPGVNRRLLGTIKIAHGARQVTYAGHALYTYSADSGPAQTDYVGFSQFGGTWPALNAAGKKVG
jgi:predicted lipoprotein with Yx(FWY)xxD motif